MTGTAVERAGTQQLAIKEWDVSYANLVKATVLKPRNRQATDVELAFFAEQCKRTGLDPIAGQIYGIYRFDRRAGAEVLTIQAGIDGFRLTAERSRKYKGQTPAQWCGDDGQWVDVWLKDTPPAAARIGVTKTGFKEPLFGVALWREYAPKQGQPQGQWGDMPSHMLAKCAEALALRKAFPNDLSGVYTTDEMAQAEPANATVVTIDVPTENGTGAQGTEEVDGEIVPDKPGEQPPTVQADQPAPTEALATAQQRKMLNAKAGEAGLADEARRAVIHCVTGQPHSDRVPKRLVTNVRDIFIAIKDAGLPPDSVVGVLRGAYEQHASKPFEADTAQLVETITTAAKDGQIEF